MNKTRIVRWAEERGILQQVTPLNEALKIQEESLELTTAIVANNRDKIIDSIGDIYIALAIQAHMQGLTVEECVDIAFDEIKDRQGSIIDGQFVKNYNGMGTR